MMEDLDPNLIAQILQMGDNDPQAAILKRQQMMADRLRNQSMQTPGTEMAGRIALPNTAQAIGNLAAGYGASRMQPQIDAGMQAMGQRNMDARRGYLDALTKSLRRKVPGQQPPATGMISGGPDMDYPETPEFHGGSY